jgi:hypothetical protein
MERTYGELGRGQDLGGNSGATSDEWAFFSGLYVI